MKHRAFHSLALLVLITAAVINPAYASSTPDTVSLQYPISSPYYPVVLTGADIPGLQGKPVGYISAHAVQQGRLHAIPFQIDRRDKDGRFQIALNAEQRAREIMQQLDNNDHCVFMAADAGTRLDHQQVQQNRFVELKLTDPDSGEHKWVYLRHDASPASSSMDYVRYDAEHDSIESDIYRIGFSRERPFLIDQLNWKDRHSGTWGADLVDSMQVRHTGKFLHRFDFVRTQDDYSSELIAIKDGPVRVIRRTDNRVRIVWILRTPSIEMDMIAYRNGFDMDTLIDVPFRIGSFFSAVETRMSLVVTPVAGQAPHRIDSPSLVDGVTINGAMDDDEQRFNSSGDQQFVLSTPGGKLLVALELEPGLPIRYQVFVIDDTSTSGPHGNIGFITTNWEAMDTELHRISVRTFLVRDLEPEEGLTLLNRAPRMLD